ncbi:carbohydrate ABC transporter permease, partial [Kitasatospora herbaricolor]|uniref:carbohydrate ABC transporter permease n=1 Tax=Kitasatospora herbaricolor TaxID=68217 RepID=UPI0036DC725E
FFREQLIGGNVFAGLQNYVQVFTDEKFWNGFLRVTVFLVVQVPIMLALSLTAALAIDSARLHGAGFFRIAIFLPYAVPGVVAALIWGFIYGDQFGLTASVNNLLGTHLAPLSGGWILGSIGNIVTWEFMGYNMLIFYAALRTIPTELYEAAEIDGAGAFRTVFSIKIPALRGAIVIATIFSIIGSFQLFNEPNLLKVLAPNAITSFFTPNMYAYNLSFAGQQFNYAATVAIVMGVITAVIAYIVQLRGTRQENR